MLPPTQLFRHEIWESSLNPPSHSTPHLTNHQVLTLLFSKYFANPSNLITPFQATVIFHLPLCNPFFPREQTKPLNVCPWRESRSTASAVQEISHHYFSWINFLSISKTLPSNLIPTLSLSILEVFLPSRNCQASRVLGGQGFRGIQQVFSGMTVAHVSISLLGDL